MATFSYDALNRRTGASYADATVNYVRDPVGRLTQLTDSIGVTITNAYDTLDRLTSQTTALGTVSYQYDISSRRTQMTVPGQTPVTYTYDAASRLTSITQGSNVVQFAYDAANRRSRLTLPNGVSTEYSYDASAQLTALTYKIGTTAIGDLQYAYDAGRNRIQVEGTWARTGLPQVVSSASYNANNQHLTFGSQSLTYDANGNLTSDGTNTYTWDARNRLGAITGPAPASFIYDGRRARKTINGIVTDFVYDRFNLVQEQSGQTITNLMRGLMVDETFSRGDATTTVFLLSDVLGSTVALADGAAGIPTTSLLSKLTGIGAVGRRLSGLVDESESRARMRFPTSAVPITQGPALLASRGAPSGGRRTGDRATPTDRDA